MLSRLILIALQLAAGWLGGRELGGRLIGAYLPPLGSLSIFVYAVVFAVVIWLVGILASLVLKDTAQPSPPTLLFAIVCGAIAAALTLVPQVTEAVSRIVQVPALAYPLIGAVIGYAVKR